MTACSTTAEALSRLAAGIGSFDVLLADKAMVSGKTRDRQQLLEASKELPCILMAVDPSPNDVLQGIQLGAVDFLAKPLSPLKLRNIWQHTVRKMMSEMNINDVKPKFSKPVCLADSHPLSPTASGSSLDLDEDIPEVMLMADMSDLCGESVTSAAPKLNAKHMLGSKSAGQSSPPTSPVKPPRSAASKISRVHSCPSRASLCSSSSSRSCVTGVCPPAPLSPGHTANGCAMDCAADAFGAESSGATHVESDEQMTKSGKAKKSIKQVASAAVSSHAPVPIKPNSLPGNQQHSLSPPPLTIPATGMSLGITTVPLPTGLGPLPSGQVWGMPMCPAVAPGISPPIYDSVPVNPAAPLPWAAMPSMIPTCGPMSMCGPLGSMPLPPFPPGFTPMVPCPPGALGVPVASAPLPIQMITMPSISSTTTSSSAPMTVMGSDHPTSPCAAAASSFDASVCADNLEPPPLEFMLGDVVAEDDGMDDLDGDMERLISGELKDDLPELRELHELETQAQGLCALRAPMGGELETQASVLCGDLTSALKLEALDASLQSAKSAPAVMLGGSLSDLFGAGSPDSSEGHLTRVDSDGMLADLESLFGLQDGLQDDCNSACLFGSLDLPLGLSLKKSDSLVDMISESLSMAGPPASA